jgi:hypothetical protein
MSGQHALYALHGLEQVGELRGRELRQALVRLLGTDEHVAGQQRLQVDEGKRVGCRQKDLRCALRESMSPIISPWDRVSRRASPNLSGDLERSEVDRARGPRAHLPLPGFAERVHSHHATFPYHRCRVRSMRDLVWCLM